MSGDKLAGATIISEKVTNEAAKKLNQTRKSASFEEFIAVKEKAERESLKPLSSDLEVVANVNQKDLMAFQGRFENGNLDPNGCNRLYGWNPKTRTALVLKIAFIEKKKKANA